MSEPTEPRDATERLAARLVRNIDRILAYRVDHNLAPDHPFWTDERILLAILMGME